MYLHKDLLIFSIYLHKGLFHCPKRRDFKCTSFALLALIKSEVVPYQWMSKGTVHFCTPRKEFTCCLSWLR